MRNKFTILTLLLVLILILTACQPSDGIEEISEEETSIVEVIVYEQTDYEYFLSVPSAEISTPVMQGEDNEYWLRRNLDEEYDIYGTPFFDYRCEVREGRNLIIYGHASEKMELFGRLSALLDERTALQEIITLYINGQPIEYVVVSVYRQPQDTELIHAQIAFNGDSDYLLWANEIEGNSLVETGRTIAVTDTVLVLQTCIMDGSNDYLIVVAKKI